MTWNRWYAFKSYLRSTIWTVPLFALLAEQATFRILMALTPDLGGIPGFTYSEAGTVAAMDWVIGSSITYMTFAFGMLLVAIQVSAGQLTPRIVATALLRNNTIRVSLGLFVYTLMLAVSVKLRTERIPPFLMSVAAILGLVGTAAFLFLIDYSARMLRPVSMVSRLGDLGLKVFEEVYPRQIKAEPSAARPDRTLDPPARTVLHQGTSAIVIAVNLQALVAEAQKADGLIEFAHRVGDFVAVGEPLFLLHGGAAAIDDSILHGLVAFGPERTIEQDSTFAVRVIVDIAIKALSKAINDPTTAVLAIDQLHRLLRAAGKRHLHDDEVCAADGRARLIFRTPDWSDFVQLAFTEIRLYGAENPQVARRLRAMIENLIQGLPEARRPALRHELDLLNGMLERLYLMPQDAVLARVADSQGLGGSSL